MNLMKTTFLPNFVDFSLQKIYPITVTTKSRQGGDLFEYNSIADCSKVQRRTSKANYAACIFCFLKYMAERNDTMGCVADHCARPFFHIDVRLKPIEKFLLYLKCSDFFVRSR